MGTPLAAFCIDHDQDLEQLNLGLRLKASSFVLLAARSTLGPLAPVRYRLISASVHGKAMEVVWSWQKGAHPYLPSVPVTDQSWMLASPHTHTHAWSSSKSRSLRCSNSNAHVCVYHY